MSYTVFRPKTAPPLPQGTPWMHAISVSPLHVTTRNIVPVFARFPLCGFPFCKTSVWFVRKSQLTIKKALSLLPSKIPRNSIAHTGWLLFFIALRNARECVCIYLGRTSRMDMPAPALPKPAMACQAARQKIARAMSWQERKPTGIRHATDPKAAESRKETKLTTREDPRFWS